MNQDRQPIVDALEAIVAPILWPATYDGVGIDGTTYAGRPIFKVVDQRLRMPDQVDVDSEMPCLFLADHGESYLPPAERLPNMTTMNIGLYIYFSAGRDPNVVPSRTMNTILNQLDRALFAATDPINQVCTLGGLVSHVWIEGELIKVPGEIDGIGLAIVPIKILVP